MAYLSLILPCFLSHIPYSLCPLGHSRVFWSTTLNQSSGSGFTFRLCDSDNKVMKSLRNAPLFK